MADLLEEDGRIDIMAGPVGASRDGHNLLRVGYWPLARVL